MSTVEVPVGRDARERRLWAAWALALAGGVSVLIAAVLVVRTDASSACTRGFPCAAIFPPGATTLALVGTVLAVVGGTVATVLAVRQVGHGDGPGPAQT